DFHCGIARSDFGLPISIRRHLNFLFAPLVLRSPSNVKCSLEIWPMFQIQRGTRPRGISAHRVSAPRISVPGVAVLIMGIALLASPIRMLAQRGGGGGGHGMPTGSGGGTGLASGVSDKDDLRNFQQAMAVQATDEQRAAFIKVAQCIQAASDRLKAFRGLLQNVPASSPPSDRATTLDEAIEQARASNKNFIASFSSKQKSGLKDIAKKLEKADSDLDKQVKVLDQIVQIVQTSKSDVEPVASSAASLAKELATFQDEQLALGREMGILLPTDGQDLTFNLPKVTNSIN